MSSLLVSSPLVAAVASPSNGEIYTEDTKQLEINEGDVEKFGKLLGIDLEKEPHFRPLVQEGILAPLPEDWKPVKDPAKDQFYYFNIRTNESQWEHPLNAVYKEKVLLARQESVMNLMQSQSLLNPRPPKSLPPLKKLGLSRPPSSVSIGRGQSQGQNQGQNLFQPSPTPSGHRLNDNLTLNRVNTSLTQLNRELNEYDGGHDDDLDRDLPPPSSRMAKKPQAGALLLTGDGANFLKPKTSSFANSNSATFANSSSASTTNVNHQNDPDFINPDHPDDSLSPPISPSYSIQPMVLEFESYSTIIPTKSILTSRKGLQNVIDSEEWMLKPEVMTGEERKLMSQINMPLKDRQGVKFSLDDNTQLSFEPVGEDSDEGVPPKAGVKNSMYPTGNTSSSPSSSVASSDNVNPPPPPKGQKLTSQPNLHGAGEKVRGQRLQAASESGFEKQKQTLRHGMEEELKKYQELLEIERKERETEMKKQLEASLETLRQENESVLQKARSDFETRKQIEMDKVKRDLEIMIQTEVDKVKAIFHADLEKRKLEHQKQHDAAMTRLSQDFEKMTDDQKSAFYDKTLSESTQKLNAQLKEHKANLQEEQRKQLQQMRDYHQTITEKLKKELESEETRIKSEHKKKLASIKEGLDKDTDQLKDKLTAIADTPIKGVDKSEMGNNATVSELGNDSNYLKFIPVATSSAMSSPTKSKPPPPPTKAKEDVKSLSEKYDQLAKKYGYLKKELRKITETTALRQSHAKEGSSGVKIKVQGRGKSHERDSGSKVKSASGSILQGQGQGQPSPRDSESDLNPESGAVSVSGSADSTTAYPSTYNNAHDNGQGSNQEQDFDHSEAQSQVDDLLAGNNDKLACALKSLETLKLQILEIQNGAPSTSGKNKDNEARSIPVTPKNSGELEMGRRGSSGGHSYKNAYPTGINNAPNNTSRRKQVNVNNPISNNHTGRKLKSSKSTPELPGLLEAIDSDPANQRSHQVVEDAKEFIRTQKERLNLTNHTPHRPSPAELALQAIHTAYNMSPATRPMTSTHPEGHLFSETESSGIGSMSFLPIGTGTGSSDLLESTEKKKIAKDIEIIVSSLSNLDEQMKLMWNVVNTANPPNATTNANATTLLSPSVYELLQNQSEPYQGLPLTSMSTLTSTSRVNLNNDYASFREAYLPLARLSPSNLLNSLDKELRVFKAKKESILNQFSTSSNKNRHHNHNNSGLIQEDPGSGGDTREKDFDQCIQDKTKDLREWLEKF